MRVEFRSVNDAILIIVAKGKLMVDIGLEAGMVTNNVLKRVDHGQDCLEVRSGVASCIAVLRYTRWLRCTSQVVVKLVLDAHVRRLVALKVDWVVLGAVVLKKLHKTDLVVVVEIHQLILSDIFCSVTTTLADIAGQGLELFVGDLAIPTASVEV